MSQALKGVQGEGFVGIKDGVLTITDPDYNPFMG